MVDAHGAQGNPSSIGLRRTATILSIALHPILVPVPVFLALSMPRMLQNAGLGILEFVAAVFFSSGSIAVALLFLRSRGIIDSLSIDDRDNRLVPLLVGALLYFLGFLVTRAIDSPAVVYGLLFCYATNTLVVAVISIRWKISIHTMATSGPVAAVIATYGTRVWPLLLLIPVVGVSRLILRKHTVLQVIAGAFLGLILTWLQLTLLF
jgi:membrane-associated phospholipid phosphatase